MKKVLAIIFILFIIVLTIFYKNSIQKINVKPANTEVIFWTLQMSDFSDYINNVIKEFEAKNPEIRIQWIDVPFQKAKKEH